MNLELSLNLISFSSQEIVDSHKELRCFRFLPTLKNLKELKSTDAISNGKKLF